MLADVACTAAGPASAVAPTTHVAASHFRVDECDMMALYPPFRNHAFSPWAAATVSRPMRSRLPLFLSLAALAGLVAAGCGPGGNGFGCQGQVCTATYDGSGSQDLSSELGQGATVAVKHIGQGTAVVSAGGATRTLGLGHPARMGTLRVTLKKADGDSATLRIVKTR